MTSQKAPSAAVPDFPRCTASDRRRFSRRRGRVVCVARSARAQMLSDLEQQRIAQLAETQRRAIAD